MSFLQKYISSTVLHIEVKLHSVKISEFSGIHILREINFGTFRSSKIAVFRDFRGSELC